MKLENIPSKLLTIKIHITITFLILLFALPFKAIYLNKLLFNSYFRIVLCEFKSFLLGLLGISFVLIIQVFNKSCGRFCSSLFLLFFGVSGIILTIIGLITNQYQNELVIIGGFDFVFIGIGTLMGTVIMYHLKIKRVINEDNKPWK
jgi:hypothetical protein